MKTNDNSSNEPIESNVSLDGILDANPIGLAPINPNGNPTPNNNGGTSPANPANPVGIPPTNPPANPPATPPTEDFFTNYLNDLLVENITEENKEIKTGLLSKFKASTLDPKGNLLNEAGEVVITSETLKAFIENGDLPLDDKGNIINAKGEIIGVDEPTSAVVDSIRSGIEANFGITFGDDVSFDDSEEGIINLVQQSLKKLNVNSVRNFLDSTPIVKSFYEHLILGGTPENFVNSHIDYKSINIKNLDEHSKLALLQKAFTMQGTPNKDSIISLIQKGGEEELNNNVASAIQYLDQKQLEYNTQTQENLAKLAKEEEARIANYWKNVETKVQAGKLGQINIPVSERTAFLEYISKPVNDKLDSAESLDMEKEDLDFDLLVSYLRYKKKDLSALASIISKEERVKSLRERMTKGTNGSGVPRTVPNNNNGGASSGNLSLDVLL